MAYFKRKPFKIEAQQVTAENINQIYDWINNSGSTAVASALEENSFTLTNSPSIRSVPVRVGSWVVDTHINTPMRFYVLSDSDFLSRFDPIADGEEVPPFQIGLPTPI